MKPRILPLITLLIAGGINSAVAAFTAPNGLAYPYRTVQWSHVESYQSSEDYRHLDPPSHPAEPIRFTNDGEGESTTKTGFFTQGPGGDSWSFTESTRNYNHSEGNTTLVYYNNYSRFTESTHSTHVSSFTKRDSYTHNYSKNLYNSDPPTDYYDNPAPDITPGGPITPSDTGDPSPYSVLVNNSSTYVMVSAIPNVDTPTSDVTTIGSEVWDNRTLYHFRYYKVVTYSQAAPSLSLTTEPDQEPPFPGDPGIPGFPGIPGSPLPGFPGEDNPASVVIDGVTVPDEGYYGTSYLTASIDIGADNPEYTGNWQCVSSFAFYTGLPVSSTDYTIAQGGSGATFTTTEPGIYEFIVHNRYSTHRFTLVMGTPEVSSLDLNIYNWEIDGYINNEYNSYSLEAGVYHFEVIPAEWLFFADYSLPFQPHWEFSRWGYNNPLDPGVTSELVDYYGLPDPNGQMLKVTITEPGLYVISASLTSPIFPVADSPGVSVDLLIDLE